MSAESKRFLPSDYVDLSADPEKREYPHKSNLLCQKIFRRWTSLVPIVEFYMFLHRLDFSSHCQPFRVIDKAMI